MKNIGKGNYYLKKFLPRLVLWGAFCGFFGLFFILTKSDFRSLELVRILIFVWLFYMFACGFFSFLLNGGFNLLKIDIEHKNSKMINKYIIDEKIDKKISNEKLKELFVVLKKEPLTVFRKIFIYTGLEIIASALTLYYVGFPFFSIIIVLIGGSISIMILALFSLFFTENFVVNKFLKQTRKMLNSRGLEFDEGVQSFTLENRLNYFIVLLFLIVVVLLSFIPNLNFFLLTILSLAFILVLIVSRMLFESIYSSFKEIKKFVVKIPKEEKTTYFTGSSYKEVLDLSDIINQSVERLYEAREKREEAQNKLRKKIEELNKWQKMTIGRELKMVELKKEIKRLEKELEKEKAKK